MTQNAQNNNRFSTPHWIVVALSMLAGLVLAWHYHDRVGSFEASHRTLAETAAAEAASQLAFVLIERQRRVQLFVEYNKPLLQRLARDPDNVTLQRDMAAALRHAFPDFFAFTLTDRSGSPLFVDFEGFVGDVCVQDIKRFAETGDYSARIHPNAHAYHYDVMAEWADADATLHMLMVSFEPGDLGQILKAIEPPGHELVMVSITEPPMIEVTAAGARDHTPRDDYRLTPDEQSRLLARSSVAQSAWAVADFERPGFFAAYRDSTLRAVALLAAVFGVAVGVSLVLLSREAARRRAAERAREELVAVITHEMRTPVTAMSGTLALLKHGVVGYLPDPMKNSFDLLDRNAQRLRRLIDDLLESRRIEQGELSLEASRVDLGHVIGEAVGQLRDYAGQMAVALDFAGPNDAIWVNADVGRLQQVVANLVSNAAKYSPEGGTVRVRVSRADSRSARVSVTDQGPGIPAAFRSRLFGKFARGPAPAHRQVASTGLGLSIVKALVEAHGGAVGFDSVEGRGTTFHFDLPLA